MILYFSKLTFKNFNKLNEFFVQSQIKFYFLQNIKQKYQKNFYSSSSESTADFQS